MIGSTVGDVIPELVAELARLPGGAASDELVQRMRDAVRAARERWPDVPDLDAGFVAYVVERARRQDDLETALARLQLDDLALAWWCTTGDSRAVAAFEAAHAEDLRRLLVRFHRLDADELRQRLRVKLFLGSDTSQPRIRDYAGFGLLQNWFRVVATRVFLDAAREHNRSRSDELPDEMLAALIDPRASPQASALRAQVIAAIKTALASALGSLPPRERTFLRHVLIDHLTLEQIATTYDIHRVSVSRIVGAARAKLREQARAAAIAELGIGPHSLASAIRELESDLDVSLTALFGDAAPS
jgi:RNA polymerase sigma-70 factor